ncbi:MAG TPA: tetratricopeptide repeat protein, partial [Gemmataceae bacterium]|nr:tetratricopeptide repeat protein [Gemmataceae bacterium]
GKVVAELRLEASDLADNDAGRQELGRLARIRYLVLGSITPFCGITVNARLVDVRTGLIVQTAKIVVRTPQEIVPRLPQLAAMLMMTDEQKMAYEQQLARQAAVEVRPVAIVALPPPPEPPVVGQPLPPPVVVYTPRPPDVGGVVVADFERLPARGTSLAVAIERDSPYKHRALHVALELGDNLFRRGRYREAHTQFELALNLSPGHKEIAFRIERCKPYVPPPPPPPPPSVVVVAPPPVIVIAPRPRVAVFNFIVNADPGYAPPGIGDWAAESMAAHFAPTYEVVDRGAVFWYMGRLGLTVRDVLVDASARLYLSRALNVRYFAFGVVQQTASFNVTTHLVDAETGAKQGSGSIHVQDHQELKLRMAELAKQTRSDPAEQARFQQEAKESEQLVNEARRLVKAGQNERAIAVARPGLKKHPNNVALRSLVQQAEQQQQAAAAEQARQQEATRRQAELIAAQRRQQEVARQAEVARQQAAKEAAARGEAARRAQEQQRQRAADQLLAQARQALAQGNPKQAVQLLESAAALNPSDAINRELARARSAVQELEKTRAAAEQRRQEADVRKQRDDLDRARARAAEDRRRREAEELARRKQTDAEQQKKAAEQKRLAEIQRQHEEQQKRRDDFHRLSTQGQTAMTAKRYDEAVRAYTEALKIMPGDPAITKALQLARQAQEASKSPPKPQPKSETPKKPQPRTDPKPQAKPDPPSKPQPPVVSPAARGEFNHQLQLGGVFEKQQKYPDAIKAYREALRLIPGDAKVKRSLEFAQKMDDGTKALNAKRFADAARSFEEALKLFPGNQDAAKALQKARQGRP